MDTGAPPPPLPTDQNPRRFASVCGATGIVNHYAIQYAQGPPQVKESFISEALTIDSKPIRALEDYQPDSSLPHFTLPGISSQAIDIKGWTHILFICDDRQLYIYSRHGEYISCISFPENIAGIWSGCTVYSNNQIRFLFIEPNIILGNTGRMRFSSAILSLDENQDYIWKSIISPRICENCLLSQLPKDSPLITPAFEQTAIVPFADKTGVIKEGTTKDCTQLTATVISNIDPSPVPDKHNAIPVELKLWLHPGWTIIEKYFYASSLQNGFYVLILESLGSEKSSKLGIVWTLCVTGLSERPIFKTHVPPSKKLHYTNGTLYIYWYHEKIVKAENSSYTVFETHHRKEFCCEDYKL